MILECSECGTRYVVPDSAIGTAGRTVRCAACHHSWFQPPAPPEQLDLLAPTEAGPVSAYPAPPAAAAPISTSIAEPVRVAPDVAAASDFDAFAHEPPFRSRRNPAKKWTLIAFVAGILMIVGVIGVVYAGGSGLATQLGISLAPQETPLTLVYNPIERRELANGSEMFAVSGKVINPTDTHQAVPDIRAELRDKQGRLVYSWTIRPEATALPPRGSVEFNSAKLDVPVNSDKLALSFSGTPRH